MPPTVDGVYHLSGPATKTTRDGREGTSYLICNHPMVRCYNDLSCLKLVDGSTSKIKDRARKQAAEAVAVANAMTCGPLKGGRGLLSVSKKDREVTKMS